MNAMITRQKGATLLGTLIVLMVAGVFFTVGFKLYTPYWEHLTIKSIIETTSQDPDQISLRLPEMRRNIDRKLHINQVTLPERDDLKIEVIEGVIHFDLKYERRVPMFYNVDAVVKFEEHFEAIKP